MNIVHCEWVQSSFSGRCAADGVTAAAAAAAGTTMYILTCFCLNTAC